MVQARTRNILIGSDFSSQEVKIVAVFCNDQEMIETFQQGKDLYVQVAAKAFNKTYNECLEFFPKGSKIKRLPNGNWTYGTEDDYDKIADGETDVYAEGKMRRKQAKLILLGMLYGRGDRALAEQLSCSLEEAKEIKDSVYNSFPKLKQFEENSINMAKELGYVTTLWGRKRRLPDIKLDEYEAFYEDGTEVPTIISEPYINQLKREWNFKEKRNIQDKAREKDGIIIKNNGGKIADATRQTLNSRIQGSASDQTKLAMIQINNNKDLRDIKCQLIIPVHDELIMKAPLRYGRRARDLFSHIMEHAADDKLGAVGTKCDTECSFEWYGEEIDFDKELHSLQDD